MLERLSQAKSFDASIVDEYIDPNREGLLQLSRYDAWLANLLAEGENPAEHLCRSLLLD